MDLSFYPRDHTAERGEKGFLLFSLEPDFGGTFLGGLSKQGVHHLVGWYSLCQLSHQLPLVAHPSVFEVEMGKENKENPAMLSLASFIISLYFKQKQVVSPSLSSPCPRPPTHFPLLLFLSISSFPSLHFPACLQSKNKNTRHMLAGRDMLEWPEYVCTHAGMRLQGGHGLFHHLKS